MKRGKIKAISLFSGCGGMDLGFEKEGFEILWALDNNYLACETYRKNFGGKIVNRDIIEIDFSKVPDCDVILGGFPCQDFSVIWSQPGLHGKRGDLYRHFVRAVIDKRPKAFVAENVKGLLSANGGKAFSQIVSDFTKVGYNVYAHVYNFADYGVPQMRERLIIIGIRNDIEHVFAKPKPTHGQGMKPYVTVEEALKNVEKVAYNNEQLNIAEKTRKMLELIPPGGNFSSIPKSSPYYVKGLISHVYRRLDKKKPSYTIIAAGGGGTWTYHHSEPRPLTNRERARLQTFPDNFVFVGSTSDVRRQIGNAVPPEGVRPIARELKNILLGNARAKNTMTKTFFEEKKTKQQNQIGKLEWWGSEKKWDKKRRDLHDFAEVLPKFGLADWRGIESYSPKEIDSFFNENNDLLVKELNRIILNHMEFYAAYYGNSRDINPRMNQCEYNLFEARNIVLKNRKNT